MNKRNLTSSDITMITMSEAAWDRNEERHRREKKNILSVLAAAIAMLVISNVWWLAHIL